MTPKDVDKLLALGEKAKRLKKAITSATAMLRSLAYRKQGGKHAARVYEITVTPDNEHMSSFRISVPAGTAHEYLKAMASFLKDEAKKQLAELELKI